MKKVLFVANTLQMGGAERILLNLVRNLDKSKYDITVLALVDYGVLVDDFKSIEGVKYIGGFKGIFRKTKLNEKSPFYKIENKMMVNKLKKYTKRIKRDADKLYRIFVKDKYDIEIAFLEGRVSKFVSCSTNPESKKIAWIHTDITRYNMLENFIDERDERDCYKKFAKERLDFDRKDGELIICAVGRLEPVKGLDRLLEVHKKLIEEGIKHQLWIVGDGKERENLMNYIKTNYLEETAKLFGYQKNPYKYIKNSDIYVCTSLVEGLSSAVIEALILEKIIVTTDCPGMLEILGQNKENGMIVDNNIDSIYEGLKNILTDEKIRKRYQENVKIGSKRFNIENTIKEIEDVLDR